MNFLLLIGVIFCLLSSIVLGFTRTASPALLRIPNKWVTMSMSSLDEKMTSVAGKGGQIDLLFDSECPICMMEVNFLKKRDIENKIKFTDLQSPDYNPADHGNVKFADGMRKLRAVLPDGKVVIGVEVFRQTYEAIGLGWVFELTKLPVLGQVADFVYDVWAENRLRLTGRGELADELKQRVEELAEAGEVSCDSDACGIDYGGLDDPDVVQMPTNSSLASG
jgi:predicted DCC family thiol-disulfide oxidoreductase YuxK